MPTPMKEDFTYAAGCVVLRTERYAFMKSWSKENVNNAFDDMLGVDKQFINLVKF